MTGKMGLGLRIRAVLEARKASKMSMIKQRIKIKTRLGN